MFEPIAIIGSGCVLPGALECDVFQKQINNGSDLISEASCELWRVDPELFLPDRGTSSFYWNSRGGYVDGFEENFDPSGFGLPADFISRLDPLFQWLFYAGRKALEQAKINFTREEVKGGAIIGNLSYPSYGLNHFAEQVWLEKSGFGDLVSENRVDWHNRFCSGLPAHLLGRALNLQGGSFALDAACASALYAIKLACEKLQRGEAEVMLTGAVNRADGLYLQLGFAALQALSKSGMSRPFHVDADGLLPAEGAVLFVLKTLERAERDNDSIMGVIRGIGVSNDGKSHGFLSPSQEGQVAAMKSAYAMSGLSPRDISLVECHATGTKVGDEAEIMSMKEVFADARTEEALPIGSLKSNLGHLVTASGAAALLKVIGAMKHQLRPASLHIEEPLSALEGSPFRVLSQSEPWERGRHGVRRAALSNFGFGGNNAHLVVEEYIEPVKKGKARPSKAAGPRPPEIAIVGMGVRAGGVKCLDDFRDLLFQTGDRRENPENPLIDSITLDMKKTPFPPVDLQETLGQQLVLLETAAEALESNASFFETHKKSGVFIGMGCDTEICRHSMKFRLPEILAKLSGKLNRKWSPQEIEKISEEMLSPLNAAGVLGAMPNIPANRLNVMYDLCAMGFTVSAEELSGIRALELARHALEQKEIDAALVGAVELGVDEIHEAATRGVLPPQKQTPGDGVVVLVLKRLEDARKSGDEIYAILGGRDDQADFSLGDEPGSFSVTSLLGHAHAASGLLQLTAAALACFHGIRVSPGSKSLPWIKQHGRVAVEVSALGGEKERVCLKPGEKLPAACLVSDVPKLRLYSGDDLSSLIRSLERKEESDRGRERLVIVAEGEKLPEKEELALKLLKNGNQKTGALAPGIFYYPRPISGEVAFVFSGAAGAYPAMGREILSAFPRLQESVLKHFSDQSPYIGWAYDARDSKNFTPFEQLCGSVFLSQIHAGLSRDVLGLSPQAVIGLSAGETSSILAFDVWRDLGDFMRELESSGVYEKELSGEFCAVHRWWKKKGVIAKRWSAWRVLAPMEKIREEVEREELVHITIINAPDDVVIGGEISALERIKKKLQTDMAVSLDFEMAIHSPEVHEIADVWRKLHTRKTWPVEGIRFYSNFLRGSYPLKSEMITEALTGQAYTMVDFPMIINQAYNDGVRIFIEHGPRSLCSGWIHQILEGKEHLAVALDSPRDSLFQVFLASGELLAAGLNPDIEKLQSGAGGWREHRAPEKNEGLLMTFPAHDPPFRLKLNDGDLMNPPPFLAHTPQERPVVAQVYETDYSFVPQAPSFESGERNTPPRVYAENGSLYSYIAGVMSALSEAHENFIKEQERAHTQFLQLQEKMFEQMSAGLGRSFPGDVTAECAPRLPHRPVESAISKESPPPVQPVLPVQMPKTLASQIQTGSAPKEPASPIQAGPVQKEPPSLKKTISLKEPWLDRKGLEIHASGKISEIFGPLFEKQDGYAKQVRMPEPPLLLADRVMLMDAEPGSLGLGSMVTQTDVLLDSWYLHQNRMPFAIMVESGQADLLLISYLGIDFLNQGKRVYRLLGCDMEFSGTLPVPGETLEFHLRVTGHAAQGDVRIFFFEYDCYVGGELRLKVRNGHAGFFSEQELANSGGVLWSPDEMTVDPETPFALPAVECQKRSFSAKEVRALSEGSVAECFGPGFERASTHTRTPKIQEGKMLLLDEVTHFEPKGGPAGRGYLRARWAFSPDDWFFQGHFKNDPVMPGTLMVEGCFQAMSFYLCALGYTLEKDGWVFEPVPAQKYTVFCRGQAIPSSKEIIYEIFVDELYREPEPVLVADILCTIDGVKACYAARLGVRLRADWPLTSRPDLLTGEIDTRALLAGEHRFDYASLLACVWGRLPDAFGPAYAGFNKNKRVPRLPGPPYHFMTRVIEVTGKIGELKEGAKAVAEYESPQEAWYFEQNDRPVMPFCVVLEAALQPCGWLASYAGSFFNEEYDLYFRNLDGSATWFEEITPGAVLTTHVQMTNVSINGPTILESFRVECFQEGRPVFQMDTVFGTFPREALVNQVGLPLSKEEKPPQGPGDFTVNLRRLPSRYFEGRLRMPTGDLLMLDEVVDLQENGGFQALGSARAQKEVQAGDWFFKAHFFQDPVQPGSLGLEALLQLLRFYMIHTGMGEALENPVFEPLQLGVGVSWKYRGQVIPENSIIETGLEITEKGSDEQGVDARAQGWLWVDSKRIYHFSDFGLRIRSERNSSESE